MILKVIAAAVALFLVLLFVWTRRRHVFFMKWTPFNSSGWTPLPNTLVFNNKVKDWEKPRARVLLVHELTHIKQQHRVTFPFWLARYMLSSQWRTRYEMEAYAEGMKEARRLRMTIISPEVMADHFVGSEAYWSKWLFLKKPLSTAETLGMLEHYLEDNA